MSDNKDNKQMNYHNVCKGYIKYIDNKEYKCNDVIFYNNLKSIFQSDLSHFKIIKQGEWGNIEYIQMSINERDNHIIDYDCNQF